jgi:hypothetical protein
MSAWLLLVLAAGGNPFLAQALEHEQNLEYEKCVERLRQAATQWKSTPDELREIELHAGLCKFNLGRGKDAAEHFRTALRIDERTELPPYTSPKAVELFYEVKQALRAPPPPLPDRDQPDPDLLSDTPKKPKLEPKPVVPEGPPLGVSLKRRAVPLTLGVMTLGAALTGLALGLAAQSRATEANAARFESDFHLLADQAKGLAAGATVSFIVTALLGLGTGIGWWVTSEPSQTAPASP